MSILKKSLACVLAAVLLTQSGGELIPIFSKIQLAQAEESEDSDFLIEDGVLTKYTGDGGTVVIPDGVTEIGNSAFLACYNLKSIILPECVTKIGDSAFFCCENLESIVLPQSLITIGNLAFVDCNSLKELILPENLKTIGLAAFQDCNGLSYIIIPQNVENIEGAVFAGCSNLKTIDVAVENKYYSSENGILYNIDKTELVCCPGGKDGTIEIPEGVLSIGYDSFNGCNNLESIIIPASVTLIDQYNPFTICENLKYIEVNDENAYYSSEDGILYDYSRTHLIRCPEGKEGNVTIPKEVTEIEKSAFWNCSDLTIIEVADENKVYTSDDGIVYTSDMTQLVVCPGGKDMATIPLGVCAINDCAFWNCRNLTSIIIPSSVTTIGEFSFALCYSLTNIDIPYGTVTIGEDAFSSCENLTTITLPSSLKQIDRDAFESCYNISDVYYAGSEEEWEKIDINEYNYYLLEATIHYNSELSTDEDIDLSQHTYELFSNTALTWEEAEAYCEGLGGHLVTITSEKEQEYVNSLLDENANNCYWIGGYYTNDCWNWITGEEFSYENWAANEPNDENNSESYIHLFGQQWTGGYGVKNVGEWNDAADTGAGYAWEFYDLENFGFICEWDENAVNSLFLKKDVWSFSNSTDAFGKVSEGYEILEDDYKRLISNLSNTEKEKIIYKSTQQSLRQGINLPGIYNYNIHDIYASIRKWMAWGGSCYAMSSWVCLAKQGILDITDVQETAASIYDASLTSEVESAINYYHFQQHLGAVTDAVAEFMALSQVEQIEALEKMSDDFQTTGKPILICYMWYTEFNDDGTCIEKSGVGHAVVGYGREDGNYKKTVNGYEHTYTHRIVIYDCAYPNGSSDYDVEDFYLYYDDNYTWCIPGHQIISSSSQRIDGMYNNGCLKLATVDETLINTVDYYSGLPSVAEDQYDKQQNLLFTPSDVPYKLKWNNGEKYANICGFTATTEDDEDQIMIILEENLTSDGEITSTTAIACLPESTSYCVETIDDPICFQFNSGNYATIVSTDEAGTVEFSVDGSVVLSTSTETMYDVRLTANEGYYTLPWYTVEILGTCEEGISVQYHDDGVILFGDNLNDITVYGESVSDKREITFSTDANQVLITNRGNEMIALADSDADGVFEDNLSEIVEYTMCGDVNGDEQIDTKDIVLLKRYIVGWQVSIYLDLADVNEDGSINLKDVALIERYVAGWDVTLGD